MYNYRKALKEKLVRVRPNLDCTQWRYLDDDGQLSEQAYPTAYEAARASTAHWRDVHKYVLRKAQDAKRKRNRKRKAQ